VPDWPTLVAVVGLRTAADAAFDPAKQATLQAVVGSDRLVAANGLSQGINQPRRSSRRLWARPPPRDRAPGVFAVNAGLSLVAALAALSLPRSRRAWSRTQAGERSARARSAVSCPWAFGFSSRIETCGPRFFC
jgi:hypothetical protein